MTMAAETELFPHRFPDDDAAVIDYLKWQYWETLNNIDHLQYVQNEQPESGAKTASSQRNTVVFF